MNTLRIASVTALVLATLLHAQALAQSQGRLDRPPGTSSARHDTPAEQRAGGEFARLVTVPAACQAAREFGQSGRWKSQLSFQEPIQVGRPPTETPGPACLAGESCFQALKSQAAAGVEYLTRNPAVAEALSSQRQGTDPRRTFQVAAVTRFLQRLLLGAL